MLCNLIPIWNCIQTQSHTSDLGATFCADIIPFLKVLISHDLLGTTSQDMNVHRLSDSQDVFQWLSQTPEFSERCLPFLIFHFLAVSSQSPAIETQFWFGSDAPWVFPEC